MRKGVTAIDLKACNRFHALPIGVCERRAMKKTRRKDSKSLFLVSLIINLIGVMFWFFSSMIEAVEGFGLYSIASLSICFTHLYLLFSIVTQWEK